MDLLLTTHLSPWKIILGKLESSLCLICLISFSTLPVIGLVLIYGGITLVNLFRLILNLVITGIFIGSIFLGFLMARIYKKLKVNNSSYYQSLYLMLILLLVRLTLRFYFTRSDYIMAIVYTIFLYTWKFKIKSKREDVLKNE